MNVGRRSALVTLRYLPTSFVQTNVLVFF
uniref:Uncharacterized protein n=1 Tax=Arundo donax TaxID=35708 RepID=A0A0A8ZPW6_ARUDO